MTIQRLIYTFLGLALAIGLQAQNEDFRQQPPKPGPAPRIELGDYEQFKLDNGLEVIVVENHKLPKVTFQLLVDVPPAAYGDKAGLPSLSGQLLSRGTANRSKNEIDEAVDFVGASLSTSETGAYGSCLSKHKAALFEIMADVVLKPAFPEDEFEKLKQQSLSALSYQESDPNFISGNVAQVLRNGSEHPYGEVVTPETLENISVADCKAYYDKNFKPNISYLAFVGDITLAEARQLAEQYFGQWEQGAVPKDFHARPKPPKETAVAFVNRDGATQSSISVTYPVNLKPGTEDAIVANVLNTLLGGGVLSSRLNLNLREDKGYSYGVRSSLSADRLIGSFSAGGSVRNEVTDSAVVEILAELQALRDELVPADELQSTKNFIFGSFARSTEQPETVARFALNIARYKLPKDYYATYLEKVEQISAEQLREAARKYLLPSQAHILIVGNADEAAEALERVAPVTLYDTKGQPISQTGKEVPEGLTALDVVERYIEALGGRSKLEAVQDISTKMSASVQGMNLSMAMKQKASGKMLMSVEMNGSVINETRYDGERAMVSAMGNKQILDGEEAESMKVRALIFPELRYGKDGYELAIAGIAEAGGEDAYKLTVKSPAGEQSTEYYSIATSLKLSSSSIQEGPQGSTTMVNEFSKYEEVEGILFPFETKSTGMAPFPIVMKVEEVKLNTGLADELFKVEE